jgi:hypothetical protein
MTTWKEAAPDIAETLEAHNEWLDACNHRLSVAEGKIFALTYLVRDLFSLVDTDAVNDRLTVLRDATNLDESETTHDKRFVDSVREVFDQLITNTPPTPPTFPRLTLIKGGRT